MVEAIKTFKFDKNVNFAGYADSKVKFAIWNLFKRYKQQWEHEESAQQEINESCMLDYLSADIDIAEEFTQQMMKEKLKVELDWGHIVVAHVSGKMRMNNIRILPGDTVVLAMSPYDLTQGRIVYNKK